MWSGWQLKSHLHFQARYAGLPSRLAAATCFQLMRLDVWPTRDLGVRKGYRLAWGIPTPGAKQLEPLGDPCRPYRSVVTWSCWRAAELYGGAAGSVLTA